MIYANVFLTMRDAQDVALEFVEKQVSAEYGAVKKIQRHLSFIEIQLRNGDEHYFMNDTTYQKWCRGRTYKMDGQLYHSGFRAERTKE